MRPLGLAFPVLCTLAVAGCGKRGDPLPPLRKTPQAVGAFRVAQRGDALEITCIAPRATVDGGRLGIVGLEVLRADTVGDFAKVARRTTRKVAPGEPLAVREPLPPVGTTLRFAARAVANGRPSVQTSVVTFKVQPAPEVPAGLSARSAATGVALAWTPPEHMPTPPPSPSPPPSPGVSPSPGPSPSAGVSPSPGPAPSPEPSPGTSPTPGPPPSASPSPSPPPRLTTGFWIYRRAKDGAYARPLQALPVATPAFDDLTTAPGESWCYVVRTVASTDPVVESASSNEACLSVEDITPPAPPTGVAVVAREGAAEVSWSPSPEPDLALYRVYRARRGAPPEPIAEVSAQSTTYRDTTLTPGSVYLYTVKAVDKAGNQSPPSVGAPGSLP